MAEPESSSRPVVRHRSRAVAAAVALTVLAVGCADDGTAGPADGGGEARPATSRGASTTTTSPADPTTEPGSTQPGPPSSSPPPAAESEEDEIVARYVAYWAARFRANSGTPNPDDPALREYATGRQLEAVITETRSNLDRGLAFRPANDPVGFQRVEVVGIEGGHAVVQECVVTDGVIFDRTTGEIVDDGVSTQNVRGELDRVDGVWRVSAARLVQQWEGVAACALAS